MYFAGIDVGASSAKLVAVDGEGRILHSARRVHHGETCSCVRDLILEMGAAGIPAQDCSGVAATGSAAASLHSRADALQVLEDVPAMVLGVAHLAPDARSIVQMGAQQAIFVAAPDDADSKGGPSGAGCDGKSSPFLSGVPRFALNESCAAGTGSFFEDQMERLGLPLEDYSRLVECAQSVPRLSGRCSVFAKTDIIHRQQEGVPVEDILQGLCHATVKTFKATIVRGLPVEPPVALVGGTLLNSGVVRAVREVFELGEEDLLADEQLLFAQALGAALHAMESVAEDGGRQTGSAARILAALGSGAPEAGTAPAAIDDEPANAGRPDAAAAAAVADAAAAPTATDSRAAGSDTAAALDDLPRLDPLPQVSCAPRRGFALASTPWNPGGAPGMEGAPEASIPVSRTVEEAAVAGEPIPCALGVDVGSTSTNLVLVGLDGVLLDAQYLRTRGNPKQAVRDGLDSLAERVGGSVRIVAAGTTGSGRNMIAKMIGADTVRDEITAQARAAVAADPKVDTVFEIGGQDSKYISLRDGQVADFQMNKVCAAGTGSFVEEQAGRLGVDLADYGELALSSPAPVDLGERCTVFVQTALGEALARGATKADVTAGLCLSVVRNYLHKVVGTKPVGQRVVLAGGVAYNPAIVAAFQAFAGEGLTVSPYFAVSGAVGVALLSLEAACESVCAGSPDGYAMAGSAEACTAGSAASVCTAGSAASVCTVGSAAGACTAGSAAYTGAFAAAAMHVSTFKGWDLSGADAAVQAVDPEEIAANRAFFRRTDELFIEGYDPERDPEKPTVGVPRCLMVHKLFPMVNAFFKQLGFNVFLTDASTEETVRLAQQSAQGETCYPVKLVHGHMAQLLDAGVDYVFMPSVHTIRHAKSCAPHDYACPYMQSIPQVVARELDYEGHGIVLLNPLLNMDFGQGALAEAMLGVGKQVGATPQETARAMLAGGFAVQEFTRKTEALGDELLASLKPGERAFVIITRNYGIVDPALNMGIPDLLLDRGQKVITASHLHAHDLDIQADHPDMYWPFGQHMLSAAKLVARDPRLFAVYLTNHGCGPDTMVSPQFREEMAGKPYLQIEMDEHYSKVGVETRIEAFLNAVARYEARDLRGDPTSRRVVNLACNPVGKPTRSLLEAKRDDSGDAAAGGPAVLGLPAYGPYGEIVAPWIEATYPGTKVELLHPGSETLERGRAETSSKEYYTFASLLGMCLEACERDGGNAGNGNAGGAGPGSDDGAGGDAGGAGSGSDDGAGGDAAGAGPDDGAGIAEAAIATIAKPRPVQLLLPASQGGEADGQYPRTIRAILDEQGLKDVSIKAPTLELLSCTSADADGLFLRLLAGDVVRAAPGHMRAELTRSLAKPTLALGDVLAAAAEASAAHRAEAASSVDGAAGAKATIAVVGEWPLTIGDDLVDGLWTRLEEEGYRIDCVPFSEYLWFLWSDCRRESEKEKDDSPLPLLGETARPADDSAACSACGIDGGCDPATIAMHTHGDSPAMSLLTAADPLAREQEQALPQDEWIAQLDRFEGMMKQVSEALGEESRFSESPSSLLESATEGVGILAAGNARYRWAKAVDASRRADGVIVVASTYENVDILLRLNGIPAQAPLVHLSFDGALDGGVEERLRSFLYYV